MSKGHECCGWTAWFEMAGLDENGRRVATPAADPLPALIAGTLPIAGDGVPAVALSGGDVDVNGAA